MTAGIASSLGLYGAALVIGFVAGMFPLVSIELFLVGVSYELSPSPGALAALVLLGALGHQVAKTICYFTGAGVLELPRGRLKERIDAASARIERWNKQRWLAFGLAATVGLPPLYALAFVAAPLMKIRFVPFTAICLVGRIGRYATMAIVPLLF